MLAIQVLWVSSRQANGILKQMFLATSTLWEHLFCSGFVFLEDWKTFSLRTDNLIMFYFKKISLSYFFPTRKVLDYFNLHIMFTEGCFRSLVFQFEVGIVLITPTFKILFSNSFETVDNFLAFSLYSGLVNYALLKIFPSKVVYCSLYSCNVSGRYLHHCLRWGFSGYDLYYFFHNARADIT